MIKTFKENNLPFIFLAQFTRINMSENALDHKTRKMIYNHIIAHPGVSYGIIKRTYDLTNGTLRYHLNYLERRNEIRSCFEERIKCYYPVENIIFNIRDDSELDTHQLNDTQELLLDIIQAHPGITQKEIVIKTDIKRFSVSTQLKRLIDFGVVRKQNDGRNTRYHYITDTELHKKVIKRLIMKLLNHEIDEQTFLMLKRKLDL